MLRKWSRVDTRAHTANEGRGRASDHVLRAIGVARSNNPVSNFHGRDIEGRTGKEMTHGQPKYNNCTVFFIEKSAIIGGDHKKKSREKRPDKGTIS